ncbi:MAG TPA: virulence protein RhuM/Fic/DOC family protein [Candidatus Dojkabacteria bacterium]|nr:virulence protein RhuM/Fic/DOC family protein [Candidatus Dojkabacteria bacterium]
MSEIKKKQKQNKSVVIYESIDGPISLNIDRQKQTIWATQKEIAEIFQIDRTVTTKHINNIFKDKEVHEKGNVQKMHIANSDRPVAYYSLDILLAVGYRTNSARAISFRQWANNILKSYILDGYAINKKLIKKNYKLFQNAVDDVKKLLPQNSTTETIGVLEIIKSFATTWLSLDAYDRSQLPEKGETLRKIDLTADELISDIQTLKKELLKNKTASELFAKERTNGAVENIVRNIFQSFNGQELYPSLEEKAAYLLYFVIKNHPFIDGNKRSGAFSFLWFLRKARLFNILQISPEVLTTLTIMIAESKMNDKEKMIRIVLMILKKSPKS